MSLGPWSARRVRYASIVWIVAALVEFVIVDQTMWHGRMVAKLLLFYGTLALLWTGLTPLVALWMRPRAGPRGAPGAALTVATWTAGIAAAGAVDAGVRRLVLALTGATVWNPFWSTWLFFIDVTAVQYGAIVLATRLLETHDALVLRTRVELRLRAQLARSRLRYLEAQLQPHFLFNALGSVCELANEAPRAAAHMLRQLAALLRAALDRRGEEVRLHEELETLEPYLDIQRMRFADWLQIEQHVSPAARDVVVPRLVLQPLVENAIKHGLAGRSAKGLIKIIARVEDGRLEVAVRDNGVGLSTAGHRPGYGIGLQNVGERLATLFGDDWRLALEEAPLGGTVALLSIPARYAPQPMTDSFAVVARTQTAAVLDFVRRHPTGATMLGWALWAVVWTAQSFAYLTLRGRTAEAEPVRLAVTHFIGAALWAAATPLVAGVARVLPVQRRGLTWRLLAHAALCVVVTLAQALTWHRVLTLVLGKDAPPWPAAYVTVMFVNVLAYFILIGITHYERTMQWLRDRENTAVALRARLEEARLQDATLRAQPEAVLQTLESLADRVTWDAAGTERALADLGDRLRRTLERGRAWSPAGD